MTYELLICNQHIWCNSWSQ